jgi:hypothetical protein
VAFLAAAALLVFSLPCLAGASIGFFEFDLFDFGVFCFRVFALLLRGGGSLAVFGYDEARRGLLRFLPSSFISVSLSIFGLNGSTSTSWLIGSISNDLPYSAASAFY